MISTGEKSIIQAGYLCCGVVNPRARITAGRRFYNGSCEDGSTVNEQTDLQSHELIFRENTLCQEDEVLDIECWMVKTSSNVEPKVK